MTSNKYGLKYYCLAVSVLLTAFSSLYFSSSLIIPKENSKEINV